MSFTVADNFTNFRIIAISNSKNNFFWSSQEFINVRKNVIVEAKVPMIVRDNDLVEVSSNIFNTTKKDIWIKVIFESKDFEIIWDSEKNIKVWKDSSQVVNFKIKNKNI